MEQKYIMATCSAGIELLNTGGNFMVWEVDEDFNMASLKNLKFLFQKALL